MSESKRVLAIVGAAAGALLFAAAAAGGEPPAEDAGGGAVLDIASYWRYHITMRDPAYGTSAADAKPKPPPKNGHRLDTQAPPEGWTAIDFDDTSWGRRPGPFFGGHGAGQPMSLGMLCLRGSFLVEDPAKAPALVLSADFRGGLVIYLNGKEIARRNLPDGPLTADPFADIYPAECYVAPDGKILRSGRQDQGRWDQRIRKVENVPVPAELLRKGTNVLAIEVHRAPTHQSWLEIKNYWKGVWNHAGLCGVRLAAAGSAALSGVAPNLSRPRGLQVWNADLAMPVFDVDYGDPNEPLRAVRMVGAQNGVFSGQVVVSSEAPIKGLKASAGDLKTADGGGTIPAAALQVRYAQAGGRAGGAGSRYPGVRDVTSFDTLEEEPPAEVPVFAKAASRRGSDRAPVFGAIQPVWVTVCVPADAPPGDYKGELTVAADGAQPVKVPLEFKVHAWKMPASRDFVMHTDFVQSPESVALHFEVPLWSDEHFKLVGKSLELLGGVANKTIYIHLIAHTNHGNSETMVRWIKEGGGYKYDYSVMEKYLDLYIEKAGKPQFVIFYVSDAYTGQGYFGGPDSKRVHKGGAKVSLVEGGKVGILVGPLYDDEGAAKAFWKPVADGVRERLKARGLEDRWCIGLASDRKPNKPTVMVWKGIAPEAKWVHQGHGLDRAYHGVPLAYNTTVWKPKWAADPDVARTYGWRETKRVAHFHRDIHRLDAITQLLESRLTGEKNIAGSQCGFGRMSADFWPVLKNNKGEMTQSISSRYPDTTWSQCNIRMTPYLAPGPKGALSTVRFEMVREGVQECEARIFIERALLDEGLRGKLGEETAKRVQEVIDRRTRMLICAGDDLGRECYSTSGWQEMSDDLYAAAAEVEAKVK